MHYKWHWRKIKCIFIVWCFFYLQKMKERCTSSQILCVIYRTWAISDSTVRKKFDGWKVDVFSRKPKKYSVRYLNEYFDQIETLSKNNLHHKTRCITEIFHTHTMSNVRHLKTNWISESRWGFRALCINYKNIMTRICIY